jgi:hypothetical protein
MGLHRIVIEASGGHGCQREKGDGEQVFGCRRMDCPDCLTQEFVEKMRKIGSVEKAELTHWPNAAEWGGTPIMDEYIGETRSIESYKNQAGETVQCVNVVPAHRIRHGYFPGHPHLKTLNP